MYKMDTLYKYDAVLCEYDMERAKKYITLGVVSWVIGISAIFAMLYYGENIEHSTLVLAASWAGFMAYGGAGLLGWHKAKYDHLKQLYKDLRETD